MGRRAFAGLGLLVAVGTAGALGSLGCDEEAPKGEPASAGAGAGAGANPAGPSAPAPPDPPRAPDIVIDASHVSVGNDRVLTTERALADHVAVFVTGRPMIAGQAVDFVAMRNAKPSHVAAVVTALQRAGATGANVKTETRDGKTEKVPLSFAKSVADCATVAWIAHDAAIDVWSAGGGKAKRILHGLAGPDITLGTDAVRERNGSCLAPELVVGADDAMSWGLVFDLATSALTAPGARTSSAYLVTSASPGRKVGP
jgi:hypothetical protein